MFLLTTRISQIYYDNETNDLIVDDDHIFPNNDCNISNTDTRDNKL